ncbi:uncharacterized protein NPIL_172391 [Nephila pilipes]|uniref:RNase H type-1 domain-containing protein n=1 Tax=Nephila pilipes TaxID=299642 RepID=A0A8X6T5R4_NEPPI|nr:uncharacterized protein NPIL_172391 [Nephila pilipes]
MHLPLDQPMSRSFDPYWNMAQRFTSVLQPLTYLCQTALKTLNTIPSIAVQIFPEGSKNEDNINGSQGLKDATSWTAYQDIWILTDSRSSIQHLQNWLRIGDRASFSKLILLQKLSFCHNVHFQWILSHISISDDEVADTLAKEGTSMTSTSSTLNLLET